MAGTGSRGSTLMGSIIDYVTSTTEDFDSRPFGEIDALVLACLSYERLPPSVPRLDDQEPRLSTWWRRARRADLRHPWTSLTTMLRAPFDGPTIAETSAMLLEADFDFAGNHTGLGRPDNTRRLVEAVGASPRFSPIRIGAVQEHVSCEHQTQFAAQTMMLPDGTLVVAYRGTDESFTGWREDFNMTFQYPVPAQESAVRYLTRVAGIWPRGRIVTTGHSKGGNLAVYAAIEAPKAIQERISLAYSLDGPGFPSDVVCGPRYRNVIGRIRKIIPDSSIVGMIFDTPEPCTVVESDQKGLMQHDAFSWQINDGILVRMPAVSPSSQYFNKTLNSWIEGLSVEQRRRTVDALFSTLESSGADTMRGMLGVIPRALPDMISSFAGLSSQDRRNILAAVNLFAKAALMRNRIRGLTPEPTIPSHPARDSGIASTSEGESA